MTIVVLENNISKALNLSTQSCTHTGGICFFVGGTILMTSHVILNVYSPELDSSSLDCFVMVHIVNGDT